MSDDEKKICLVLTCDRPFYRERRHASADTYEILKKNGFTVIFLYANASLLKPEFELKGGEYCLTLPTEESYNNLPTKILKAFKFFSEYNIKGILKIDDDTRIQDPNIFDPDFTDLDYAGASVGYMSVGPRMFDKGVVNIDREINYFGGPFYWLSARALHYVIKGEFKYPWEDACVGYCLGPESHRLLVRYLPFNTSKQVVWSNETEKPSTENS
jgi:hypothetical protein